MHVYSIVASRRDVCMPRRIAKNAMQITVRLDEKIVAVADTMAKKLNKKQEDGAPPLGRSDILRMAISKGLVEMRSDQS